MLFQSFNISDKPTLGEDDALVKYTIADRAAVVPWSVSEPRRLLVTFHRTVSVGKRKQEAKYREFTHVFIK